MSRKPQPAAWPMTTHATALRFVLPDHEPVPAAPVEVTPLQDLLDMRIARNLRDLRSQKGGTAWLNR